MTEISQDLLLKLKFLHPIEKKIPLERIIGNKSMIGSIKYSGFQLTDRR